MSTSLIIQTEDYLTGSPQQMTITDINPNATNANLKTFAQMTAALSKDTYVKAARVDKEELDNSKSAFTISENISIGDTNFQAVDGTVTASIPLSKMTTGSTNYFTIIITGSNSSDAISPMTKFPVWTSDNSQMRSFIWGGANAGSGIVRRLQLRIYPTAGRVAQTVTGKLLVPESESFKELELNFIITITEEG